MIIDKRQLSWSRYYKLKLYCILENETNKVIIDATWSWPIVYIFMHLARENITLSKLHQV